MVGLYLAPGHGVQPDGVFDPGAQYGGLIEHSLNTLVVAACAVALARSGYADVHVEPNGGKDRDPNYVGSTRLANDLHAQYVIEVHHNAGGIPDTMGGSEALVYVDTGATGRLGHAVAEELRAALGRGNRGVIVRTDLYLLSQTTGIACIPEVLFVDADHAWIKSHPGYTTAAGEALAKAFLRVVGRPYVPPGAPIWHVFDQHGAPVGTYRDKALLLGQVGRMVDAGQTVITIKR